MLALLRVLLILSFSSWASAQVRVKNYTTSFLDCTRPSDSSIMVGLRQFNLNSVATRLLVDSTTLKTSLVNASDVNCASLDADKFKLTYYAQLLNQSVVEPQRLENVGIKSLNRTGAVLSIDMCPSFLPYEKALFDWIRTDRIPMVISLTHAWAWKHQSEFDDLKNIARANGNVTWVNHTYRHNYTKGAPKDKNFLLLPGENIEHQVLDNEIYMLENELLPSVFFRFPGLISSPELIAKISGWGLITLGSDSWLTRKQMPRPGSIILIHGNGNEPEGVQLLFKYLNQILTLGLTTLS